MRRVVITGIGIVSPTGIGRDSLWDAVVSGRSGISPITRFDAASYSCRVAGEISDTTHQDVIDPRTLRVTPRATQLALAAAEFALRDARLPAAHYEPYRFGVTCGTALGGQADAEKQVAIFLERGARRVNPFILAGSPNHGPATEIANAVGAQGPHLTVSSGCPSSLQAIGHAAALIAADQADACLAGGTENPITPLIFAALCRTQELSTLNDDPARSSRPFDREHAGMVLSEGSAFLTLEAEEAAVQRGATIYGSILGSAGSCDARGLYTVEPSGEVAARALHGLLQRCGMTPGDIDYVCSHANAAPVFDRKETVVLKRAFGEFAARIPVSSIKAVLGHPFGASGAFQVATAALSLQNQLIPPTHNLGDPADECDLDYVPGAARPATLRNAVVTSYGYGGVNSYLLIGRA